MVAEKVENFTGNYRFFATGCVATFYCEHIFIVNIFGETFYRLSRIIWLY